LVYENKDIVIKFVYDRIMRQLKILSRWFRIMAHNSQMMLSKNSNKIGHQTCITTTYKPNTNRFMECTNKVWWNVLKKETCKQENLNNWNKNIHHAMWVYNFKFKLFTWFIPFKLAYGKELTSNIEYEVMTFGMIKWHQLQVEEC
jgi:hypothetical protein